MKSSNKILLLLCTLAGMLSAWIAYNTYPVWRDYLQDAPVDFRENAQISLNLYPETFQSAAVFTNNGLSAAIPIDSIINLGVLIGEMKVRGAFFITPFDGAKNKLHIKSQQMPLLYKLRGNGQEIAQYGYLGDNPQSEGRGAEPEKEMLFLSLSEQLERISTGRKILTSVGFIPRGHRSPCFSGTPDTFLALDELGFLYGSDQKTPPLTLETLLKPRSRGRIMYPYHPRGLRLLEVISQVDPTVRMEKAKNIFKRFHQRGGVFVYFTEFPEINEAENLHRLGEFLMYLKSHNTWLCTLEEICQWWLAREKVKITTQVESDTLVIIYGNPSAFPLKNATITFKKRVDHLKFYRIMDTHGKVSSAGFIPTSRRVLATLFPD